jgi:hypothetical protein
MSTLRSGDDTPLRCEVLLRSPGAPGPTLGAWVVVVGACVVVVVGGTVVVVVGGTVVVVDVVVVGGGITEK